MMHIPMTERKNSILLAFYMQMVLFYYLISSLRIVLFPLIMLCCIWTCWLLRKIKFSKINMQCLYLYFLLALSIQFINTSINVFVLFLLFAPIFATWMHMAFFKTSILRAFYYVTVLLLLILYLRHSSFIGVFAGLSENYVSVILICNVVLIAAIEKRQNERISVLPSCCAVLLSLLAFGRSGILCTFVLFCAFVGEKLMRLLKRRRNLLFSIFFFIVSAVVLYNYERISDLFMNMEMLEKFRERGLKSPSRGILLDEYMEHMNEVTIFTGYHFDDNAWFAHYGFNPHNSYVRLHYRIGFAAFLLLGYVGINMMRKVKNSPLFIFMLCVMMLRAYTDVYLFYGFYDFIVFYLLLASGKQLVNNSFNDIKCVKNGNKQNFR